MVGFLEEDSRVPQTFKLLPILRVFDLFKYAGELFFPFLLHKVEAFGMSNNLTVEKTVAVRMVGMIMGVNQVADITIGKLSHLLQVISNVFQQVRCVYDNDVFVTDDVAPVGVRKSWLWIDMGIDRVRQPT